jgi:hypothetical protein
MPRVDTFEKLLEACGMDIELAHKRGVGVDTTLIERLLPLSPEERIEEGLAALDQLPERGVLLDRR